MGYIAHIYIIYQCLVPKNVITHEYAKENDEPCKLWVAHFQTEYVRCAGLLVCCHHAVPAAKPS